MKTNRAVRGVRKRFIGSCTPTSMFRHPFVQVSLSHANVRDGCATQRTTKFINNGGGHAFRETIFKPEERASLKRIAKYQVEVDVRIGSRE